ncbi:MAG: MopE-related protein, partial [Actinomycetota bacterium]
TFIGGSVSEFARGLAIDSAGNVFVAGITVSDDYPTTLGAYDQTCGTGGSCNFHYDGVQWVYEYDGFVSRLNSNLTSLLASTFIGGSVSDKASALAIDSTGNVFVAGSTNSSDYPTTSGAYDTTLNLGDVFVSKLDPDLSACTPSIEICDGIDNNCDGQIDEGVFNTYYQDFDGDTYGNPLVSQQACTQPSGYISNNTDCNDSDSSINPAATEICDGLDNDCNGFIDDGLTSPLN